MVSVVHAMIGLKDDEEKKEPQRLDSDMLTTVNSNAAGGPSPQLISPKLHFEDSGDAHIGASDFVQQLGHDTTWDEDDDLTYPPRISNLLLSRLSRWQKIHAVLDAQGFLEEHYAEKHRFLSNMSFIVTFVLIIASVITFTIESLPGYYRRNLRSFFIFESGCIGWFSIELIARLATTSDYGKFMKSPMNWIDLIAIVPFYLDIAIAGSGGGSNALVILRVIRLTRVFRVFKLSKYNEGVQVVISAVKKSSDALSLLVFLMTIAMVLFGSSIFFLEQAAADFRNGTWVRKPEYGGPEVIHPFKSIPHGFWWCLVTITTVGYGDMYPVTPGGYVLGSAAMMTSLLLVAFPIIILGANFTEARIQYFKEKELDIRTKKYQRRYLIDRLSTPLSGIELQRILQDGLPDLPSHRKSDIETTNVSHLIAMLNQKMDSFTLDIPEMVSDAIAAATEGGINPDGKLGGTSISGL